MNGHKFYAVRQGRTPGIYFTWEDCKAQVDQYPNAEYKKFSTPDDAYAYMQEKDKSGESEASGRMKMPDGPYAFVDGSFNADTKAYGYGGFLDVDGRRFPLMGSGNDPELASMRNVAGEIYGSMAAVHKAEELGLRKITILYDYMGIEQWAKGNWKANKQATQDYKDFMNPFNRRVSIDFEHVQAHTGIEGNEMADVMAKSAVGLKLTGPQQKLLQEALQLGRRDGSASVPDLDSEGKSEREMGE